jgi:hypothetical protein
MMRCQGSRLAALAALIAGGLAAPARGGEATDWLPDLFFAPGAMSAQSIDTNTQPGRVLFRFSTSIPNVGLGEFRLQTNEVHVGGGREEVVQVIQRSDGSTRTRRAGDFLYNREDFHMEAAGWADYRIRALLPENGVGEVLRTGAKESVRITSSALHDASLPNVPPSSQRLLAFMGTHGISVGYTDLYPQTLPLQWVDVTGLPSGTYWLEAEVDGANHIEESDETNNLTRILVTLDLPDIEGVPEGESGAEGEPATGHAADRDADGRIGLDELLRVIQLYNSLEYACDPLGEDGYAPGPGVRDCLPHSADYAPPDWRLSLSEVLRVIQIFNALGYAECSGAEDGFCPLFS